MPDWEKRHLKIRFFLNNFEILLNPSGQKQEKKKKKKTRFSALLRFIKSTKTRLKKENTFLVPLAIPEMYKDNAEKEETGKIVKCLLASYP